ncbi:MAG: DUF998 domain-containing protein [Verrucomicrobiaceae bacterium]|jgi:hypothetical protein|nr:DUF998 domain-containing protein [Verrucomicrobiaceae bacterium]
MNDRSFLSRLLDSGIALCLLVVLGTLFYGHVGGAESGLSLMDSYITEYMKKAPHWPWLIVASFAFALLLFLLALAFLRQSGGNVLVLAGSLLLAATAMGNFFVAYAPMRRVEQPPPAMHEWWTPTWWFTSKTSHTDYEHGMADAYSDVHYRAIRLVVSFGVAGIFSIAAAGLRDAGWRSFGRWTLAAAAMMSVLFLMGDHWDFRRGLWQRLGFAIMYVWLWGAWAVCRAPRKFSSANGNSR